MKTQLTIRETSKLIELGVRENALTETVYHIGTPFRTEPYIYRTFTLTDLLGILPKEPLADYCLQITNWRNDIWYVGYTMKDEDPLIMYNCGELIDGLYKLVIWCIEHGYIETE